MCTECWWDCLNAGQQTGVVIIGAILAVLWYAWGTLVLKFCFIRPRIWPKGIEWLAVTLPTILAIFIAIAIVYGLYGAVACLFFVLGG